jgi:hypothetical protein
MNGARYQVRRYSAERGQMEIVRGLNERRADEIIARDSYAGTVSTKAAEVRVSGRMVVRG